MRIALILFILLFSNAAYCCSCVPLDKIDDNQYKKYDVIFKGKVLSVTTTGATKEVVFEVATPFKGGDKMRKLTVKTEAHESECGISPKVGEVWLVFAYKEQNGFQTNLCTRTKNMDSKTWNYRKEELQQDIEYLNQKLRD